jgi:hypothetical protein
MRGLYHQPPETVRDGKRNGGVIMKRLVLFACSVCSGVLFQLPRSPATLVPQLDLGALTSQADLIAVGLVAEVYQEGATILDINGVTAEGHGMRARLAVERIIKGESPSGDLIFRFALPDAPAGYPGIGKGQFGVFFLRKGTRGYEILDPYYPFVVAGPGAPNVSGNYSDQVIAEVAHVFSLTSSSLDTRLRALLILSTVRTDGATAGLKIAARASDVRVQSWALGALLRRNDISLMDSAEEMMLSQDPKITSDLKAAIAYGLRDGVKDARAIPALARLLESTDPNVRRGTASALRNTQDSAAIKPLAHALYDSDPEVQYQAVMGLAEITGTVGEWAPASDTFLKDRQRYLDHWREWAQKRR